MTVRADETAEAGLSLTRILLAQDVNISQRQVSHQLDDDQPCEEEEAEYSSLPVCFSSNISRGIGRGFHMSLRIHQHLMRSAVSEPALPSGQL